jgi:hypothetical protein
LPGVGSVVPGGGVTVAVLVTVPGVVAVPVTVNVTKTVSAVAAPPVSTGRSTATERLPMPEGEVQSAPPVPVQIQLTAVISVGSVSSSITPFATLGPLFHTTMV